MEFRSTAACHPYPEQLISDRWSCNENPRDERAFTKALSTYDLGRAGDAHFFLPASAGNSKLICRWLSPRGAGASWVYRITQIAEGEHVSLRLLFFRSIEYSYVIPAPITCSSYIERWWIALERNENF